MSLFLVCTKRAFVFTVSGSRWAFLAAGLNISAKERCLQEVSRRCFSKSSPNYGPGTMHETGAVCWQWRQLWGPNGSLLAAAWKGSAKDGFCKRKDGIASAGVRFAVPGSVHGNEEL
jgi:hypothetical protein